MLNKFLLLGFTLFTLALSAQKGNLYVETNYNTYSHSSLSSFQKELFRSLDIQVPLKITDDFPGYIGFTIGYEITQIKTSFFLSYNSTGGKMSYADYSGVIRLEQPLSAITFGGMYNLNIGNNFRAGFRAFTTFSNLKLKSYSRLDTFENTELIKLNATDFGIGTAIIYEYPVSFFKIRASVGFDLVLGGDLNFKDIENSHLIDNSGDKVKTGWSGFRSGLGITIPIN